MKRVSVVRSAAIVWNGWGIVRNPHFWAIFLIILILGFVYYYEIIFFNLSDLRRSWLFNLVFFEFTNDLHGSLFFIPYIYSAIVFGWRGISITWLLSMALILPRIKYYAPDTISLITNIIFLLVPLLIMFILTLQIKWRETERKALAERENERQNYIAQILQIQEDERKRISREIHDDTTQRLWIEANHLQRFANDKLRGHPQIMAELEKIGEEILHISEDAKRLSLALRPSILDDLGPVHAIRWLVNNLNREGTIEAKLLLLNDYHYNLSDEVSTHLFRIAQEALNNVRRHSGATRVVVIMEFKPQIIRMTIEDNGKGFLVKNINKLPKQSRLGIMGIQERVRLLNGTFKINSKHHKGTKVTVEFRV
jgi:signal transduction histidine kinase